MDLRTAIAVEARREAVEDELRAVLATATQEEGAVSEPEEFADENERPSARKRFRAIGERILALADKKTAIRSRGDWAGEKHKGMVELGVNGLAIIVRARQPYTPGSLRGMQLEHVEVEWTKDTYAASAPLARQSLGLSDIQPNNITPEVYGTLRLMEQSLAVAEVARQGAVAA